MSSCEKCWTDAQSMGIDYGAMLKMRKDTPCTAEQQAGRGAGECPVCKRRTEHEYTKELMCGCRRPDKATAAE